MTPRAGALYLPLLLAVALVSLGAIFVRLADSPPLTVAFYRVALASLLLAPFAGRSLARSWPALGTRERLLMAASGVALAAHFASWIASLSFTSVAASVLLVNTAPLFTLSLSRLFLGEAVPPAVVAAIVLALPGAALVALGEPSARHSWTGDLLALIGAATLALYHLCGRALRAALPLGAYVLGVWITAAVVLLVVAWTAAVPLTGLSPRALLWLLALAVLPTVGGHGLVNHSLRRLPAPTVGLFLLGEPIGASLLALLVFGEVPGPWTIAGGLLVLAALALALRYSAAPAPRVGTLAMTTRRRVHVLFTGGTISMRIDPGTGAAVPALSGANIVARVHGLKKEARLTVEDYARLPGPHVTPRWMWRLKGHVQRLLSERRVDAVVLTHGTDTLEETAYLLDLTLDGDKPVVFCGAMRTVSEPGWDGPANLMAAVRTAVHPESRGRGVLVTVGEEVHAAAEATKWHTQHLNAFRSPHGPLGFFDRGRVVYARPRFRGPRLPALRLVPDVDLHTMAAGVGDTLLRASLARGARGLVLEATGCGNVPPATLPALRAAIAARLPVVLVSRCSEGSVSPTYGYQGGGKMLSDMGVIFGRDLPGPKARIKLMVALGLTADPARIRRIFEGPSEPA